MPDMFQCRVITPEGPVLDRQATSVRFPAHDGMVGIWPNHAPMISLVGVGSLILRAGDERAWFIDMSGGFAEVRDNLLTILAVHTGELLERSPETVDRPLDEAKRELTAPESESEEPTDDVDPSQC